MISKYLSAILIGILSIFLGWNCTTNPVASGTEVGNPEIAATIQAMRSMLADDSSHKLTTYISRQLLDPSPQKPPAVLAKKAVEPCSVTTIDTIVNIREEWVESPIVINDTILNKYLVYDTVRSIKNNDTLISVSQSWVTDSIIIKDTVINKHRKLITDSLFIITKTPCPTKLTSAPIAPITKPKDKQHTDIETGASYKEAKYEPVKDSVLLQFETTDGKNLVRSGKNFTNKQKALQTVVDISKTYRQSNGTTVKVTYSDADGDSQLYTAAANTMPAVLVKGQWNLNSNNVFLSSIINNFSKSDVLHNLANLQSLQRLILSPSSDTLQSVAFNRPALQLNITNNIAIDTLAKTIHNIHFNKGAADVINESKQFHFRSMSYHNIFVKFAHVGGKADIIRHFEISVDKENGLPAAFSGTVNLQQHIKGLWTSQDIQLYILSIPGDPIQISSSAF